MSEKKTVYKPLTIGVGALCAVLLIALSYSVVNYNSIIRDKDAQITSLNMQIANLGGNASDKDTIITDLQNQVKNLTEIINLTKYDVWFDAPLTMNIGPHGSNPTYAGGETDYAGYFTVKIESSTVDDVTVQVIYSSHGLNYDQQVTVGSGETAVFPILPTHDVEVRVGNPNDMQATIVVTMTYYY